MAVKKNKKEEKTEQKQDVQQEEEEGPTLKIVNNPSYEDRAPITNREEVNKIITQTS